MTRDAEYFKANAQLYRKTLLEDVMPFWMARGFADDSGAITNCLDDEGKLVSRDRYIWSQGRALWTFSALCNRVQTQAGWVTRATELYEYLQANGRDENGHWCYRLDENEKIVEGPTSIFVDGFVLNGLTEYHALTRDSKAATLAKQTYQSISDRLAKPGSYGIAPYEIPDGAKAMAVRMIFSFFFNQYGRQFRDNNAIVQAAVLGAEILDDFCLEDTRTVMEFIGQDNSYMGEVDICRVCIPGHVIEAMWFLISSFESTGDNEIISQCCELITRHLELGWDSEFGGIRLAVDVEGYKCGAWDKADCKPWWVQLEALVATAYAYLHTRDESFLDWHEKIKEFAFAHYPQPGGEWTQWLDRAGNKAGSAGLPVKDPFHLPRAMIYLIDLFENRLPGI